MIGEETELLRSAIRLLEADGYEVRKKRRPDAPLRLCDVALRPGAVFKLRRNGVEFIVLDIKDQFGQVYMWDIKQRRTMAGISPTTEIEIISK